MSWCHEMLLILNRVIMIERAIALGSHEPSHNFSFELCLVELLRNPKHVASIYSCLIVVLNTKDDKKR